MRGVGQFIITEAKLQGRNFMSLFFMLFFPVMMLFLFGGIYGNKPTSFFGGHGTVDVSVPAYLVMIITVAGIMTFPISFTSYRERKVLKRFRATPVNPWVPMLSQLVVILALMLVGMVLLFVQGKIFFGLRFFGLVGPLFIALVLVTLSIFALGLVIAGTAKNTKSANAIASLIYFPLIFLSGATIPLELMPKNMVTIASLLPTTHAVRLLKGIWLGGHLADYYPEIWFLAAFLVVFGGITAFTFRWE